MGAGVVESAGSRSSVLTDSPDPLKGKCALGPFLSILVIECQHKVLKCESMPMDGQVANHK
jgi:hypothetical protein